MTCEEAKKILRQMNKTNKNMTDLLIKLKDINSNNFNTTAGNIIIENLQDLFGTFLVNFYQEKIELEKFIMDNC